jgi:hypothetical protein
MYPIAENPAFDTRVHSSCQASLLFKHRRLERLALGLDWSLRYTLSLEFGTFKILWGDVTKAGNGRRLGVIL